MGKPISYNTLRKRMAAKDWPPNLGLVATTQVMFLNNFIQEDCEK